MSETPQTALPPRMDRRKAVRLYAAAGAAFWVVAAVVAYARSASIGTVGALAVLAFVIAAALAVSWFHESAGAVVMLAAAVATVAYGVLRHWDIAFWFMMLLAAIGPLLLAAYLFDAVRRQDPGPSGDGASQAR